MVTINILKDFFGIDSGTRTIAIVGAGGKTSLMYFLAREVLGQGRTVVSTTTAKIFPPALQQSECLIKLSEDPELQSLSCCLSKFGHVTVGRDILPSTGKLDGIDQDMVDLCLAAAQHVLVEADGAAGRSIKAPEKWEPVIPRQANLVIAVVGMDCLGKPVEDEWVFGLERFTAITGLIKGKIITPHAIGALLGHPDGGLKGVPDAADFIAFLNKEDQIVDVGSTEETAKSIISQIGSRIKCVVAGSLARKDFSGKKFLNEPFSTDRNLKDKS